MFCIKNCSDSSLFKKIVLKISHLWQIPGFQYKNAIFFKPQRIFFLTLCQNNFRNKILFLHFTIQIWTNLSVSVVWLDNKTCQLIKQDSPSFFSFSVKMRWLHKKNCWGTATMYVCCLKKMGQKIGTFYYCVSMLQIQGQMWWKWNQVLKVR